MAKLVPSTEVCKRLNVSRARLTELDKSGALKPARRGAPGVASMYRASEVTAYKRNRDALKRAMKRLTG